MEIKNILLIVGIVVIILGLSLMFIQTEIGMKLLGTILMASGIFLFVAYLIQKGQPS